MRWEKDRARRGRARQERQSGWRECVGERVGEGVDDQADRGVGERVVKLNYYWSLSPSTVTSLH